jgi:ubiquinone/menaquinone biosynthesis C-methylase UbiE
MDRSGGFVKRDANPRFPIVDFDAESMRGTYAGRTVDPLWSEAFLETFPIGREVRILDVGCGAGIYMAALRQAGARAVFGMDSSLLSLDSARVSQPSAYATSLVSASAVALPFATESIGIVLARALIHHLKGEQLGLFLTEAHRCCQRGGFVWLQSRCGDDLSLPASNNNLRGYFLEAFPHLYEIELERRPESATVVKALEQSGFDGVTTRKLYETRKIFQSPAVLEAEIRSRRGRSILHALTDEQLGVLAGSVVEQIDAWPVVERDRWTIWTATRP